MMRKRLSLLQIYANFLRRNWALFFVLFLVVFLRIPSLFEPYWYGDEGIYFAVGETLKRGGVLYKDVIDNKTPLIYYLFAGLKTQFWVRVIACLWVLTNTVFVYFLAKVLFGRKGAGPSAFVFGVLASLPLLEGNIANGELFFILFTTIGFFLIARAQFLNFSISQFFVSGSLFALAFLFKTPSLTDFGAAMTFLFLTQTSFKKFLKKSSLLIFGFLLAVLPFVAYFVLSGCFSQFLGASFFNNVPYTAAWGGGIFDAKALFFLKSFLLFFLLLTLFVFRKKVGLSTLLIYPWLFFSFFGAVLSNRPYPHYLIQIVPAFSLLLGKSISQKKSALDIPLIFLTVFLVLRFFNFGPSNFRYQITYFQNFKDFALGGKSEKQYLAFFDPITPRNYKIADFLRENTEYDDKIFVWGDQALIYALSERSVAGRYVAAHHINDIRGAREETVLALRRESPKYILVDTQTKFPFPGLFEILKENYNERARFEEIEIYQSKQQLKEEV